MALSQNIKFLRKRKGLSQDELANALRIKRTTLNNYENKGSFPKRELLVKLSAFFRITLDDLIKSNLFELSEETLDELEKKHGSIDVQGNAMRILTTSVNSDEKENITLVNEHAKAGYTTGYADREYIERLPTFSLPMLNRIGTYRTFPVEGDSMPPVKHGSWIIGQYVQNWLTEIKDKNPYIVITREEGIVFKIVYNHIKQNGNLLLCSSNPAYEPYTVAVEDIVEIWKFSCYIQPEF